MGQKETSGSDRFVYGTDCDDSFMVYTYLQTHQVVDMKYLQLFVC